MSPSISYSGCKNDAARDAYMRINQLNINPNNLYMSDIIPTDTAPAPAPVLDTPVEKKGPIKRMINGHPFWVNDNTEFARREMPPEKSNLIVIEGLAEYQHIANFIVHWYLVRYGLPDTIDFYNLTHSSFLYYQIILTLGKIDERAADLCYKHISYNASYAHDEAYKNNDEYYENLFCYYKEFDEDGPKTMPEFPRGRPARRYPLEGEHRAQHTRFEVKNDYYLHINESADTAKVLENIGKNDDFIAVISRANLTNDDLGRKSAPIAGTQWWFTTWGTSHTTLPIFNPLVIYDREYTDKDRFVSPAFYIPESDNPADFKSLLGLTMAVKNAGKQFEETLRKALKLVDYWVIYDTGSTDGTLETIRAVTTELGLPGRLYTSHIPIEELDFSVIRNRCLDWASNRCTYFITLDDTYVVPPSICDFVRDIAGDQFADTISVFINSRDTYYASNRIIKTTHKRHRYKYRIHEVIIEYDNNNIILPFHIGQIFDGRYDYMEERTMDRKPYELLWLAEDLEKYPNDPRPYYYMAQVYQLMGDNEKALHYFGLRINAPNKGYAQELYDAIFEFARTSMALGCKWEEVAHYYNKCIELMPSRAEPYYYLGIHYLTDPKDYNIELALQYFRQGFILGNNPDAFQFGIRPSIYNFYLPLNAMKHTHLLPKEYRFGLAAAQRFIENYSECKKIVPAYEADIFNLDLAHSFYNMYLYQVAMENELTAAAKVGPPALALAPPTKPICVFIADGGYKPWSGTTMLVEGVGGSETYIIEMAEKIHKMGAFQVYVFCKCPVEVEIFNGVTYKPLDKVWEFFAKNYVHSCMVSRFIDYLPAVYMAPVENVYLILHDIMPIGSTFIRNAKLKAIYCLSDWHAEFTKRIFAPCANIIRPFSYGCANKLIDMSKVKKTRWSFIYSSFPNRGLLPLLQMWKRIVEIQPRATLNLYCDLDGEWVNQNYPAQMGEIRDLLSAYAADEVTADTITVHGWVDKATLSAAWRSADIWFYPCIFEETFCLTALEAATAGVLVVTNGIAALQTTVGDRGIIIPNWTVSASTASDEEPMPALEPIPENTDAESDKTNVTASESTPAPNPAQDPASTTEQIINPLHPLWQQRALDALTPFLKTQSDPMTVAVKTQLITKNQTWAAGLTWQNRAADLVSQWMSGYDYKMNYSGIRNLSVDQWDVMRAMISPRLVNDNVLSQESPKTYKILDINSHTGMSAIELLHNTMPRTQSPRPLSVHGVECVQLSGIHPDTQLQSIQANVIRFLKTLPVALRPEFIMHPGDAMKSLMQLITTGFIGQFDLVIYTCTSTYDIGAHLHIIDELINKTGGLLIINMLNYKEQAPHVNYFINSYQYKHKIVPVHDIYKDAIECISVVQYGDGPLPSKTAI